MAGSENSGMTEHDLTDYAARSFMMSRRIAAIMENRESFAAAQSVLAIAPVDADLFNRDSDWLSRHEGHVCDMQCLLDDPLV